MAIEPVMVPEHLVSRLREARRVTVLTGAGVSAESGISTFRDTEGLWARFNPEEVATRAAFRRDPQRVWSWYAERRGNIAQARPNAGHLALAALEARVPEFVLVTQNIDGLHRRAGSRHVVELHGNIFRLRCFDEDVPVGDVADAVNDSPPRCRSCGGYLRPDVVWFGEMLPPDALGEAITAAQRCDLFLSVGTSGLVEPAASLPLEGLRHGAAVAEVNTEDTPLTPLAFAVLRGRCGDVLPALVAAAWPD